MKRYKKLLYITIFGIICFIIDFFWTFLEIINDPFNNFSIKEIWKYMNSAIKQIQDEHFWNYILVIFFSILCGIFIKIAIAIAKRDNLEKIDFQKYKCLYREFIYNYSPAVLSYVDNLKVERKKVFVANILGLQKKNYIDIKNNEIRIINRNYEMLEENEKYILENKIFNIDWFTFEKKIREDALKKKLIFKDEEKIKRNDNKPITFFITLLLITTGILAILFIIFGGKLENFTDSLSNFIEYGLLASIFILPTIVLVFCFTYIINVDDYSRTEVGNDINIKLEGLNAYITNFSKLDEKSIIDLKLWDEYLIYSIIFEHNYKIVDEIFNYKFID